jgi:hypothetical protein
MRVVHRQFIRLEFIALDRPPKEAVLSDMNAMASRIDLIEQTLDQPVNFRVQKIVACVE